jgi:hypothetical protein
MRPSRAPLGGPQLLALVVVALASALVSAQRGRMFEGRGIIPRFAPPEFKDGAFTVCKLMYTSVRSEAMGMGWATDYPNAGRHLMIRLSELTKADVSMAGDEPNQWVVRLTDDALFNCPFTMASDVGTIGLSTEEAQRLREYLLKGGFLWVDDFWGSEAWTQWVSQLSLVLSPLEYPIEDLPLDHPLYSTWSYVAKVPQITNIQFWRRVGGTTTSERGDDSAEPHLRVVRDRSGRIMVLMTHNTDISDAWEREGEDPGFFYQFSPDGYALGINVVLYAMSH